MAQARCFSVGAQWPRHCIHQSTQPLWATSVEGFMFLVRQRSALNGFHYHFLTTEDQPIAELEWPNFANSLKSLAQMSPEASPLDDLHIRMAPGRAASADYRISHVFLNRERRKDVRFTLHQGGAPLAIGEVLFPKQRFQRPRIEVVSPLNATLVRHSTVGRSSYCWERDGRTLGTIEEPKWLTMKRELTVNLPSTIPLPVQIFMSFLVINDAFR